MAQPKPEKAKLDFEETNNWSSTSIQNPNVAHYREGIDSLQKISEKVLYHWKSYPIQLPSSILDNKSICIKDLFILPTFDELDALTTDCKGNPKFLIHNQLESIKRKGLFTVSSINFPKQTHVWKLNPLFQKGVETAREEYLDGIAFALRFIIIYSPELVLGHKFSLFQGISSVKNDLIELIDLILGFGKVHVQNLEKKIHEERCKFLVAELKCKGDGAKMVGRYVRNQTNKALREKVTMAMERPPPIPYRYSTPVSLDVDLRLFDRDIFHKIGQPLSRILEKSSRGWFLSFREKVISELKSRKMSESEIEMEANIMVMDEYLKRVYLGIKNCPEIQTIGQDISRLLIEQAQSFVLMHRAVDNVAIKLESHLRDKRKFLIGTYPVLSRDLIWMETQMENAKKEFFDENRWLPHEIALELCRDHFLKQQTYFSGRDLAFMRDTEEVLRKELKAEKVPCRIFEWKTLIWRPKNYRITRTLHGQTETIPTIISQVSTTITSPRSDPYHPTFTMKRMNSRFTTSRWPLWRITNIIFRTVCWILNAMYFLGYVIPWNSPVGFRALFLKRPFLVSLVLNQVNGSLCPKKSSQTSTLTSRLIGIWRRVSKARTRFESQPDIGFLGRGWSRFQNRSWNYVFKGFLPSFVLVTLFPTVSIFTCFLSIFLAVTSILWMPYVVLLFQLVCIFIYDFDCPVPKRPKFCTIFIILGSLLIRGVLKSIVCFVGATIVSPIVSGLIVIWTLIMFGIRRAWDSLMFYALIKPKGRLPSGNSWLVKRIMGPGLAPEFFFEINTEQALIAFVTRLELEELNIFYQKTNLLITQPQIEYKNFFSPIFTYYSGKLIETEGPYKNLIRETQILRSNLEDRVMTRRQELETGLNVNTRSKIRMKKPDLEKTLLAASKMAQNFYIEKIFSRLNSEEEIDTYWETRGLENSDWMNLTLLLMSEVFCQDFLTPLEDSDVAFRLETTIKGTPIPTDLLLNSIEDDYWSGQSPVTMSKIKYQIHSPYLDISAFNPMFRSATLTGDISQMLIPLPILHPSYISIIIYGRETEHPFQIDHPICQAILKALQDSGPMLNQDCISLDLDTSLSSSEELEEDTEFRNTSPLHDNEILTFDDTPVSSPVIYIPEDKPNLGTSSSPIIQIMNRSRLYHQRSSIAQAAPETTSTSQKSHRQTPTLPIDLEKVTNTTSANIKGVSNSSKASLASPEEINLDDSLIAKLGTSV